MQKRRRVILSLIGAGILVGVLAVVFRPAQEPEYGGKRLSYYIEFLGSGNVGGQIRRAGMDSPSVEAVNHIGTNAIPFLLRWIRYDQPPWKAKLYSTLNSRFGWDLFDKREARAEGASVAFWTLGSRAEQAIPELTRVLIDRIGSKAAPRAMLALHCVGKVGLRRGLLVFGTNVVPSLIEWLDASSLNLRNAATNALRELDPRALERGTNQQRRPGY